MVWKSHESHLILLFVGLMKGIVLLFHGDIVSAVQVLNFWVGNLSVMSG